MKKTKIVATMGPASTASKEVLRSMILEGVDVCRLNFSHGSHEDHLRTINMIREINREEGLHISILADLQGPKIRIGEVENNAVELADGSKLVITTSPCLGTAEKVHLTYSDFPKDVAIGDFVLLVGDFGSKLPIFELIFFEFTGCEFSSKSGNSAVKISGKTSTS